VRRFWLALVVGLVSLVGCDVPDYELVDDTAPSIDDADDDVADVTDVADTAETETADDTGSADSGVDAAPDTLDASEDASETDAEASPPDTFDAAPDTLVLPDGDACPSSLLLCGARCVDISSDPANCGDCDKACLTFGACVGAVCKCLAPKTTVCSGACTDLASDVDHCGSCAVKCAAGQSCVSGHCK
jgi:hypothetical protein